MTRTRPWLENAWYAAGLTRELLGSQLLHRRLLDVPVVMYRKLDGSLVALHDRCPHRFAPLSTGRREGDEIVCGYHALRFDCSGKCTHNPHGPGAIPRGARVRTFTLTERDGFLWIWMGEAEPDYDKLPQHGELVSGPETAVGYTYMFVKGNYQLVTDNVMDLSHVDHVHGELISTRGQLTPLVPDVRQGRDTVAVRWEWAQTPPMLIFNQFLPAPMDEARMFVEVNWTVPTHLQLSIGATQDPDAELDLESTVSQYDFHTVTPETADTTHYWFATRRNHLEDDAEYNEMKIRGMHGAFATEDVPLIEAVHAEMGPDDFFSLDPVLMSNDTAPVRARRILAAHIKREAEAAV